MNSNSPSSEERRIAGHPLTWHRWHPADSELKGAMFFIHGQGDFGERYQEVAELFVSEGIAFATCDLPGHGRSPGKRGHIPSLDIVEEVTKLGLAEARELANGKPVGLGAHSAGALLALYLLGELAEIPDFCWISSPLLNTQANQPAWKQVLAKPLSLFFPSFTVSTGVSSELCREDSPEETKSDQQQFHSRISLAWGLLLIELGEIVRTQPERLPEHLPLLITQGGKDRICPLQFCEEFVCRLQRKDLQLTVFPDARHEPFADEDREEVFATIQKWLAQVV